MADPGQSLDRWLERVVGGLAALAVLGFVAVALLRVAYPFDLEWLEGATLHHVHRLLTAAPLYVAPTIDFTPSLYTPLYYVAAAPLAWGLGETFLPLRLLSLGSTLACLWLLFANVRQHGGRRIDGWLAAGVFAACFEAGGGFFDLARIDMFALALTLGGLHALGGARDARGYALAGVLLACAVLAKQTALAPALGLAVWATVFRGGGHRWLLPAALAVLVGGACSWLEWRSDGWFGFYAWTLPRGHAWIGKALHGFWWTDLLGVLPLGLLALGALAARAARERDAATLAWWGVLAAGLLGGAWLSRLHAGGYLNVLLPAYALLALALGHASAVLRAGPPARHRWVWAACALQLVWLGWDPRAHVPDESDRAAGRALVERLDEARGEVWIPAHGWLTARSGGVFTAHEFSLRDVLRSGRADVAGPLDAEIRAAIAGGRWREIWLNADFYTDAIERAYRPSGPLFDSADAGYPVEGLRTRPQQRFSLRAASGAAVPSATRGGVAADRYPVAFGQAEPGR